MIKIEDINEKSFAHELWTGDVPAPELVVRTGKHDRLSNFLLYQSAYSTIAFEDYLWPDISPERIDACIDKFEKATHNLGA